MTPSLKLSRCLAAVLATTLTGAGCGRLEELGFRDRVLHDVASPDGRYRAVCQEVPMLDGPAFDIRLHEAAGGVVRTLASAGDAYPCKELAWSPAGDWLGILQPYSTLVVVDMHDALATPKEQRLWNRQVSLTWPQGTAARVRFVDAAIVEFDACDASNYSLIQGCLVDMERRRMDISTTPAHGVSLRQSR